MPEHGSLERATHTARVCAREGGLPALRKIANRALDRCARCGAILPADAPVNRKYCRPKSKCRMAVHRTRKRELRAAIEK